MTYVWQIITNARVYAGRKSAPQEIQTRTGGARIIAMLDTTVLGEVA